MQEILLAAQVIVTLTVLMYASWSDYKTREVSNKVWAIYAPIALGLTLPQILLSPDPLSQLSLYGLSVGLTVGISLLLFDTGAFGGADSKAFMCIALALPFAPIAVFTPLIQGPTSPISQYIFPITIFGNAVLFAAASGIYMIIRNIVWHKKTKTPLFPGSLAKESIGKKILVLITGYRMTISKVKEKWHIFPMEDIEENTESNRKLGLVPREEGRDKILERLSNAIDSGKIDKYVWATPGLPMLIFVTLGLIVAVVFGDVVWLLVRVVLGG